MPPAYRSRGRAGYAIAGPSSSGSTSRPSGPAPRSSSPPNQSLISTLDEVVKIQEEGKTRRREAEQELGRLENELKQKLLDIRA